MAFMIQLLVAITSLLLAFALWHRAMPPVIAMRGRLRAMATWALGMALSIYGGLFLTAALSDAPLHPMMLLGQLCLIGSGCVHLHRTTELGPQRWTAHSCRPKSAKVIPK